MNFPRFNTTFTAITTSKRVAVFAVALGLGTLGYLGYRNAAIVKVGANSTTYTYADIREVYTFGNKLAAIRGAKPAPNWQSVFQSMMVAGIEHEIGVARRFPQPDIEKTTNLIISQSPFAGALAKERESIGPERFHKLFVMPILADQEFGRYYMAKEGNRQLADTALKAALQGGGLAGATEKSGEQARRVTIPVNGDTASVAAEAKKSIGAILPKYVEDGSGYAIMQPVEVTDTQITADVVFIPRQPASAFIESELKEAKIPVTDRLYSWFRVADLRKAGGALASAPPAKAGKPQGDGK